MRIRLILQREDIDFAGGLCLSMATHFYLSEVCDDFLHSQEKEYYDSLSHPKRQYSYLLGRYCAKHAISTYSKVNDLSAIYIGHGIFQQPVVSCSKNPNLQVSITHNDVLGAALAFPETHPMGIDVEVICNTKMKILQKQVSIYEKTQSIIDFNNIIELTLLWTTKEALSKVLKCGLMLPFHLLEIKSLQRKKRFVTSHFRHFHQYQAISFIIDKVVCSIVYPRKTQLNLNICEIQKFFDDCS